MTQIPPAHGRGKKNHQAVFNDPVVHFAHAVHGRKRFRIARASRRLLQRDVAVSAAWPSEARIRVPSRLRKQGRALENARSLIRRMDEVMRARSWTSFIRLAIHHPASVGHAYRLVVAKKIWPGIQRINATRKIRTLVWFTLRHPLAAVLYVWPNIKITRTKKGREVEDHDPIEPLPDLDPHDPAWLDGVLDPIDRADELYLERQKLSAAERQQDSYLFGGHDRDHSGFVRLALRESYHDLLVPGRGDETQAVVFEPRLFLHWSGVAMLSIRIECEGSLSADEVIDLMMGNAPRIARSRMAEPLVRGTVMERFVTHWSEEKLDAGARLAVFEWESAISMIDLLRAQTELLERVIGTRFDHFVTYPTAIFQAGECCSPRKFRTTHENDVQRITMRAQSLRTLAPHVEKEPDWSITTDHSLYVGLGSSAYIQWAGQRPLGLDELDTTLVVEYGLTLYERLQAMEQDVSRMRLGERRLRRRYRDAILLFSELRQGDVRAGTARVIVRHLLNQLGADQMRPTIESALNLASMAHGTVSAEKASRRAWWLALVGTVVAAIVSIPTLTDLLSSLPVDGQGGIGEIVLGPLRWAASLGYWGPWALVGVVVGALLVLWLVRTIIRGWPRARLDLRRGYAWPTEFHVVYEEDDSSGKA